ncbi:MAG: zinc ribbon domain-containing protein [Acidobacteria bacterium]|nr:zinc ribbon domain-containing protein [Acidobacteriota bacterium]
MFCPRCGSPNPDTTKFCRKCGLGLQPVTGYVASGGTASLQQPQQPQLGTGDLISRATSGMTPKQQMILLIMLMAFSPAIFGTLGLGTLSGISAVLMPIGIVFTIMRFKAQQRRLREVMMAQQMYPPMQPQMMQPPVAPYSLPQPTQQPIPQNYQQPVYQQPSPPPTNPLQQPLSVVEDETRKLPGQG